MRTADRRPGGRGPRLAALWARAARTGGPPPSLPAPDALYRRWIGAISRSRCASTTCGRSARLDAASHGEKSGRIRRDVGAARRPSDRRPDRPAADDDRDGRATLDVLTEVVTPALFTDKNLLPLVICRMANLSLEHGNSDGSCFAYVWLGMIAGPIFDNYAAGFRFGRLGYELVEKRGCAGTRPAPTCPSATWSCPGPGTCGAGGSWCDAPSTRRTGRRPDVRGLCRNNLNTDLLARRGSAHRNAAGSRAGLEFAAKPASASSSTSSPRNSPWS